MFDFYDWIIIFIICVLCVIIYENNRLPSQGFAESEHVPHESSDVKSYDHCALRNYLLETGIKHYISAQKIHSNIIIDSHIDDKTRSIMVCFQSNIVMKISTFSTKIIFYHSLSATHLKQQIFTYHHEVQIYDKNNKHRCFKKVFYTNSFQNESNQCAVQLIGDQAISDKLIIELIMQCDQIISNYDQINMNHLLRKLEN
jgi:hypothetical protein